jgi:hypothetical protein
MRNYTWYYGLFHWAIHFLLTILIIWTSGIEIFPLYAFITIYGREFSVNIVDYLVAILITMLIDLDHITVWRKVGIKRVVHVQKKLISPVHNFFFLSFFSILAAISSLFLSKVAGVLLFVIVAHMLWDIYEDVFIFQVSFRRWEKTWGLNKKDLEDAYNDLPKIEPIIDAPQEKKKSRIATLALKIRESLRRKSNKA